MKTGVEFRDGISGTGGTQSWVQNVQEEKKIIVRISNHKKIQSLEELGSMKKIQRTCRPENALTSSPNLEP